MGGLRTPQRRSRQGVDRGLLAPGVMALPKSRATVEWGSLESEEGRQHLLPVTYGLSVLVNAELATRALMRKALSDSRVAALSPSCSHGGASLVGTRGPFSLPTHVTRQAIRFTKAVYEPYNMSEHGRDGPAVRSRCQRSERSTVPTRTPRALTS